MINNFYQCLRKGGDTKLNLEFLGNLFVLDNLSQQIIQILILDYSHFSIATNS